MKSEDIRILALDLDGTLLTSAKTLADGDRAALEEAAAKGVLVVPTTGRFFGMMPEPVRTLPFVRYAITVNGAQVYDRVTDTALVREEIPLATALGIMEILDRHDVIYDCYRGNWGWMTAAFKEKAADYATNGHYLKMIREFRNGVDDLKSRLARDGEDVQKVMLFSRNDRPADGILREIAEEVSARYPEIKATSSAWNNLELNIASANKGNALRRLAESLGLTLANTMSFGDGTNDLTMIEAAGTGVAMANAVDAVKSAADYITLSNDECGVASALRHFGVISPPRGFMV